jgi:hypothetical protein
MRFEKGMNIQKILYAILTVLLVCGVSLPLQAGNREAVRSFDRAALAKHLNDGQKQPPFTWGIRGKTNEILIATSSGEMFSDECIRVITDDIKMHALLRKMGFRRIVFEDRRQDNGKAFIIGASAFVPTR